MSAWIVSKNHIDVLITAALAWELIVQERADEAGRMLWEECRLSVAHLYPDEKEGEWPGPWDLDRERPGPPGLTRADIQAYRFTPIAGAVDPEIVSYAAGSLGHQSCEHPGWPASPARVLVLQLKLAAEDLKPAHRQRHGPLLRAEAGPRGWSADEPQVFLKAAELRQAARRQSPVVTHPPRERASE